MEHVPLTKEAASNSKNRPALSRQQSTQEAEYKFPYHYIPEVGQAGFSQIQMWPWGMRYLAGIELVLSEIEKLEFSSLLDIGCGDGRFLFEVEKKFHDKQLLGVDYSERAIELATALSSKVRYVCSDITAGDISEQFDVVTMVEVLEHIPLESVDKFLDAIASSLAPTGTLILTVPHQNKRLSEKHFQHFTVDSLQQILSRRFRISKIFPFDHNSRLTYWFAKLLGYGGSNYVISNHRLNNLLYRRILRSCLNQMPEGKCCRLLAIANVRS